MNTTDSLKISVITVSYNSAKTIQNTISSVEAQDYPNFEYIIVDGDSNDGTLDIIKNHEHIIHKWISEKDSGIYDAMNKGLKMATGDLLILLNSDDQFSHSHALKEIARQYQGPETILIADTLMIKGRVESVWKVKELKNLYFQLPFMHTSCFVPREVYTQLGYYNTQYKIAADCDFLLRTLRANCKFHKLEKPVVKMFEGGASEKNFILGRKEYREIYSRLFQNRILAWWGYSYSLFDFFILGPLVRKIKGR